MTENELRLLINRSEKDGFRELFMQYSRYVYTIVWKRLRYVGTSGDAEECVSDIFADVFLEFDNIDQGKLKSYIGTVAKRTSIDRYRKLTSSNKLISENEDEILLLASDEDIEYNSEISETQKLLFEKICLLGEPDSTLIIHKYFYDRNSKDIAKEMNMNPVTVRVRIARALEKLKKILDKEEFLFSEVIVDEKTAQYSKKGKRQNC